MMDLHSKFVSLLVFCTTTFTVLQGQKVVTDREVTGYRGDDVTLPCHFRSTKEKFNQVEWTWRNKSNEKNSLIKIIIFNSQHGNYEHETFLKNRVSFRINSSLMSDASIIIKDVKMTDQGVYTCDFSTYPSGSNLGETILKVIEGKSPDRSIAATAGILTVIITIILASVGYFFLIKRRRAASTSAYFTTQNPANIQQGDVTYADVTILKPDKVNRNTLPTENIEYAAVSFSCKTQMTSQQGSANQMTFNAHSSEHESVYAEVKKTDVHY